jgi:hypothetical protein
MLTSSEASSPETNSLLWVAQAAGVESTSPQLTKLTWLNLALFNYQETQNIS